MLYSLTVGSESGVSSFPRRIPKKRPKHQIDAGAGRGQAPFFKLAELKKLFFTLYFFLLR